MRDHAADTGRTADLVELRVDSRLDRVELLARTARWLAQDAGLAPALVARVELCVAEAANNAVCHAYRGEPGHPVTMRWSIVRRALRIEVSERGAAMSAAPCGELPSPRETGGRGWFLLRRCTDRVEYRSEAGENTVRMTLRVDDEPTAAPPGVPDPCPDC